MSQSVGKRFLVEKGQPTLHPIRIRHAQPQALNAPGVAPELIADPKDNTVKVEYLEDDGKVLQITIPNWPVMAPVGRYDLLTVTHDQTGKTLLEEQFDIDDAGRFPLPIPFDRLQLAQWADGDHSFSYEVKQYTGSTTGSDKLTLRFDRKPPYDKATPDAFPVIADITDATITTVKLSLPAYPDRADGDKVFWFWLNKVPGEGEVVDPDGAVDVGALPQDIAVPAETIRELGDGGVYALYVLKDKAGNLSRLSAPRAVGVAIGPPPDSLQAPLVAAADDGVIDQQDVFDGIVVQVLAFANAKPTDEVRVIWGSDTSEWREVGSLNAFPMDFRITPTVVWGSYGAGSTGAVAVKVAYEVRRGTVPQGGRDIDVMVNLERVGPVGPGPDPDPEWPKPVNPRLPLPAVYGKSSNTENALRPDDEFEDAQLFLQIDASLQEGDVLTFYWDDTHLDTLDYPLAKEDIGDELEFAVPWAAIAARGNDIVPVHYKVRRPGNPNVVWSDTVDVDVTAIGIHPEQPKFLGGNTSDPIGWLTCDALYDDGDPDNPLDPAIRVQVPDLAQYGLQVGDKVTLKWTAVQGFVGETPVPGVDLDETIDLTATNINGFVWRVQPYAQHILPIFNPPTDNDGRGRVHYEFELAGRTYESDIEEQVVAVHDAAGSCPLRP
ncbi:hypothetical protein [Pseudomonas sp. S1(2024)]|uniref:hypothetical protein n=1 Tax=Pseudomonas sp. S1(2024) TaxID=3390191 RepID=UPI0039795711